MNTDADYLLIGQLVKQANTTKDTIRHYDQLGLLKSRKRQAGSRYYTEYHRQCIDRIKIIKEAQAVGFKLSEIKDSFNDYYDGNLDIDEQILTIQQKLQQARRQQRNLVSVIQQLTERLAVLNQLKLDEQALSSPLDADDPSNSSNSSDDDPSPSS